MDPKLLNKLAVKPLTLTRILSLKLGRWKSSSVKPQWKGMATLKNTNMDSEEEKQRSGHRAG